MSFIDYPLVTTLMHPCIGAFIGYLTNKIAIRMLFRPLRPWYVFGIRLPMTPGVIPAKRRQLAENIGEMVGRHLLTSKDIGAAISEEPFQDHLTALVDRKVKEALKKECGTLAEVIPGRFRAYFQVGIKTLKYRLGEGVNAFLASEEFERQLTGALASALPSLGKRELNSLFSVEDRQAVYLLFDEIISDLLSNNKAKGWLAQQVSGGIRHAAATNKTLADLLPPSLTQLLREEMHQLSLALLQKTGIFLADPLLRGQVVQGIAAGVDHFLDTLGPVGAMAKGFLETDQLKPVIGRYLEDKEENLAAWLQRPEVRERMAAGLLAQVDEVLNKPVARLLASLGDERLDALSQGCAEQILAALNTEGAMTMLKVLLHTSAEDLLAGGQRSLDDLATQFFTSDRAQSVSQSFLRESLILLRSGPAERLVHTLVNAMVDTVAARPLGRLYDLIPHGVRQGAAEYIILTANRMLLHEVPGLVDSLNIRQMVTEKVNTLDLLQLERLLLSIMEEQFKYINLFGAILGFLIGFINLALAHFL